jgi:hypothetical protein
VLHGELDTHYGRDCCTYLWCCPCAVCQDGRELKWLTAQRGSFSETELHHIESDGSIAPPASPSRATGKPPLTPYDPTTCQYPVDDIPQFTPQIYAYPPD